MKRIWCYALVLSLLGFRFSAAAAHEHSGGPAAASQSHQHHHHCDHGHEHDHHHRYHDRDDVAEAEVKKRELLPEELAEEEDLKLYGFGDGDGAHHNHHHQHHHDHDGHKHHQASSELSGFGLWVHAMGCSLLVSLASLICLVLLPLIFVQGKPTKAVVDSLALFGAGAMLGDAFLHQLPHAFGGEHSHSHDHHMDHAHDHSSHSHSLADLSVGLSVLAGIVLFLLVEKLVRYVDGLSGGANALSHGHHHHLHKHSIKQNVDSDTKENHQGLSNDDKKGASVNTSSEGKVLDEMSGDTRNGIKQSEQAVLRKRNTSTDRSEGKAGQEALSSIIDTAGIKEEPAKGSSNIVFGYLNLFSDGVHNFTDGMALGSAFLLYGSIGGWSRTLFLLAHELPQEIGDFGILVRSGFGVSRALFFNFLSALVALVGTALALMLGQDPGHSSLIEGFTAGGFIYIAVAGVLAEMNNDSSTSISFRSTAIQLISLTLGIAVALCISLVE